MEKPKFAVGQPVRITNGEYKRQEGVIYQSATYTRRYLVKVRHEGFPEHHYHHIWFFEKSLEAIQI